MEHDTIRLTNIDKTCETLKMTQVKKGSSCYIGIVATIATILVLALVIMVVIFALNPTSNGRIQALEMNIENLQELLNQTRNDISASKIRDDVLQKYNKLIRAFHPASCKDIPQGSPSGDYWIIPSSSDVPVQVYCDMTRSCCGTSGGWTRVANLDMTDPSQECPDGFRLVNRTTAPLRTCGRAKPGCASTTYPTHGIEYSQVCGRVIGYQIGSPDAFLPYYDHKRTIDQGYVDGVSLTRGQSPRQHIWTFANAIDETRSQQWVCPCTRPDIPYTGTVPPFIGQDYFCETGSRGEFEYKFYPDDPLWDGQGCGGTSTCCSFNNPPWFCKLLDQRTTDDIELRLCSRQELRDEGTPIEMADVYIR